MFLKDIWALIFNTTKVAIKINQGTTMTNIKTARRSNKYSGLVLWLVFG